MNQTELLNTIEMNKAERENVSDNEQSEALTTRTSRTYVYFLLKFFYFIMYVSLSIKENLHNRFKKPTYQSTNLILRELTYIFL